MAAATLPAFAPLLPSFPLAAVPPAVPPPRPLAAAKQGGQVGLAGVEGLFPDACIESMGLVSGELTPRSTV